MPATDEKGGALATAAVAAAAGVAAYGLRKALNSEGGMTSLVSRNDSDDDDDDEYVDDDDDGEYTEERNGGSQGRGGSLLASVWDTASDTLMPLAEEAAEAAGKWTAENAPDIVRDQLMPRFIESFNDAA